MSLRPVFKTPANARPVEGDREMPDLLDFTLVTAIEGDLSNEQRLSDIPTIQSVFIDNWDNPASLQIQFNFGVGQRIECPAFSQGIFPVFASGAIKYTATSGGAIAVRLIWSNTARDFFVWKRAALISLTRTVFSSAAGGAIQGIAAVAGKIIRVYRLFLVSTGATNLKFQSAGTDLCGAMAFAANGSITLANSDIEPWFTCGVNEAFNINSTAATQISGALYSTQLNL